ncbi:hypothetical protein [Chryseobacterium echinoideorum]|uniref:hypothetical protein n=1 Tax=Chryseobacterium echinoideorum TaxID=1549648 RepID=UPI0011866DA1|nr:hypothetical protein [Chryseobacterium echinoideorum]
MPNQTPSQISDDFYPVYNHSKTKIEQLQNRFLTNTYTENSFKTIQNTLQNAAIKYAGELAALNELKNLASEEISNKSVKPMVLADLLEQAIAIADEINQSDRKPILTEAIYEAKAVLEAIYDGTIDDFKMPDADKNTPSFSEEFEVLKIAILSTQDQNLNAENIIYKN